MKKLAKKLTKEWLKWKYGPRCDDFMSGCVGCNKWQCFDGLFKRVDPLTLEEDIQKLEKDLKWKKEMLQEFQRDLTVTPESTASESIVPFGDGMNPTTSRNQDSVPS